MPELPEVEKARWLLEKHARGKAVREVVTAEQGGGPREGEFDDKVFVASSVADGAVFEEALRGQTCAQVRRKGKQLWWELQGKTKARAKLTPLFHFGMTGMFLIKGVESMEYKSFKIHDATWPPKFTKCEIVFEDGTRVAFVDPRRLGRIQLRADPLAEPPLDKMAPDCLVELPNATDFGEKLRKSKKVLKAVLLDQNAVVSGIGNWMADEVLFQARIDPRVRCDQLNEAETTRLHAAVDAVTSQACRLLKSNETLPEAWLFHHRWHKGRGKSEKPKMLGHAIEFITCGGRTTAFVPALQGGNKDDEAQEPAAKPPPEKETSGKNKKASTVKSEPLPNIKSEDARSARRRSRASSAAKPEPSSKLAPSSKGNKRVKK